MGIYFPFYPWVGGYLVEGYKGKKMGRVNLIIGKYKILSVPGELTVGFDMYFSTANTNCRMKKTKATVSMKILIFRTRSSMIKLKIWYYYWQ